MRRRVLVVDDDEDIRNTLGDVLREAGFAVTQASNGLAALTLLRAPEPPDVIVLDLMMPVMDGWEFRAAQKRDPSLAATPVIVLTANESHEAAAIDADAVLSKPFRFQCLLDTIAGVLSTAERRNLAARMAHADRLASLGTLAAGIAHEINNPLTVVSEGLRYAERALKNDAWQDEREKLEQRLKQAIECAERISAIVRDVATFARADAPNSVVDVRAAARAAVAMVSGGSSRLMPIIATAYAETPPIVGNEGRLVQVFVNLLMNAVQALPDDRPGRIIVQSGETADGEAEVVISDNGRGIPTELIGKVFDPFFTTKSVGDGIGLGLSISHGIVSALGGRIEIESDIGRGTTARVVLPATSMFRSSQPNG